MSITLFHAPPPFQVLRLDHDDAFGSVEVSLDSTKLASLSRDQLDPGVVLAEAPLPQLRVGLQRFRGVLRPEVSVAGQALRRAGSDGASASRLAGAIILTGGVAGVVFAAVGVLGSLASGATTAGAVFVFSLVLGALSGAQCWLGALVLRRSERGSIAALVVTLANVPLVLLGEGKGGVAIIMLVWTALSSLMLVDAIRGIRLMKSFQPPHA